MNGLDGTTLKAYIGFLALGLAYDQIIKTNFRVGHPPIDDCPAWTWYVGLTMQGFVYPYLFVRAVWASGDMGLLAWFRSSWSDRRLAGGTFWEQLWFASFLAYLTRDYAYALASPMYVAHHVVCQIGVIFSLWIPRGSVPLLCGMMMLELGSLGMTCAKILPSAEHADPRWDGLYYVLMSISNVLCLFCAAYNVIVPFGLKRTWLERSSKVFFALLTAVLVFMRQSTADEYRAAAEERYTALKHMQVPDEDKWIGDDTAAALSAALGVTWISLSVRSFWTSYKREGYIMYRFEKVGRKGKDV